MIQIKDVKIGNFLNNGDRVVVVSAIFKSHFKCETLEQITMDTSVQLNYTGIELNPVNLLKCGFALGDGYYWKTWGTNGVFIVKFDTVYNKFFVEAGKGFNLLVEYVHELQNAFYVFSLGRELEVVW